MWEFEIVNIQKAKAPDSSQTGRWYQYTIANRITEISGMRRGSKEEVMNFVKSSIQRLNNRHRAPTFCKS
jgi:hypothetical protein